MHAAAWTLATGAAVTVSWAGVHTVMSGTAYDPPRALPLSDAAPSSDAAAEPRVSSTHRPRPTSAPHTGSPSPRPPEPAAPSRSGGAPHRPSPAPPARTAPADDGHVKSYTTAGGRVVLELDDDHAALVSATPNAGWEMQVWKQDSWLRVDFTGPGHVSVICTWNGHPPMVQRTESSN